MTTGSRRFDDIGDEAEAFVGAAIRAPCTRPYAAIDTDATAAHRRLFRRVSLDLGSTAAAALPTGKRIAASGRTYDPR